MDNTEIMLLLQQNDELKKQNKALQEDLKNNEYLYPQTIQKYVKQENEQLQIVEKAIRHYGENLQKVVAIEEMSELMKELVKDIRGVGKREDIIEEIADVEIMLQQLCLIYKCPFEVLEMRKVKIERLKTRLENESIQ